MTAAATVYSPGQLAYLASQVGFSGDAERNIVAVDLAESGGNPAAVGDVSLEDATWGPSEGLGQIRSLRAQKGTGGVRDELANRDPLTNLKHQYEISKGGTDLSPWSTWWGNARARTGPGRGTFLNFLPAASAAVGAPDPNVPAPASGTTTAQGTTAGWTDALPWNWGSGIADIFFPAMVNIAFITAGLGLVMLGVYKVANPGVSIKQATSDASQAIGMAAVAA